MKKVKYNLLSSTMSHKHLMVFSVFLKTKVRKRPEGRKEGRKGKEKKKDKGKKR